MKILKKEPGIMLVEQYGKKYIRFDGGRIGVEIFQIKITDEEFERVLKDEVTMISVVYYYENRGCCRSELRNILIKDYLRTIEGYSEQELDKIIEKLEKHGDIYFEFYDYVLYEEFIEDELIIEGYSAKQLFDTAKFTPLEAYNYLIYLRENPQEALMKLKVLNSNTNEDDCDSLLKYNIVTKGGSMCFYGEWFGRPYDNFHQIVKTNYENDCLNIYFDKGEILSVFNPVEIVNEEKCFEIKKASKVIWQYIPYGSSSSDSVKYIYKDCGNGKIIKTIFDKEEIICPEENAAVQCLSY